LVTNSLNGEIKLKSEVGKGTEFIVIFPRVILE
jgi:signal transduction histidine kinase